MTGKEGYGGLRKALSSEEKKISRLKPSIRRRGNGLQLKGPLPDRDPKLNKEPRRDQSSPWKDEESLKGRDHGLGLG